MQRAKRVSIGSWLILGVTVAAATASAIGVAQFRGQADFYRQRQLRLSRVQGALYKLEALNSHLDSCQSGSTTHAEWAVTLEILKQQAEILRKDKDLKLQDIGNTVKTSIGNSSQCGQASSKVAQTYSQAEAKLSQAIEEYEGAAHESIWKSEIEACLGLLAFVISLAMILWRMGVARHGAEVAEAEAKILKTSERTLHTLTEKSSDLLFVVDENGAWKHVGSSISNVLGYSAGPTVPSLLDLIDADDRAAALQALKAAAAQEGHNEKIELRFRHADSSLRTFEVIISNCLSVKGIDGVVLNGHDITERKRTEEKLKYDAFHDGLTDLPNRTLFYDRLQRAVNRARRNAEYHYAVLFIDVDRFKLINDSLGHTAGDGLLVEIAARLRNCIRQTIPERRPTGDDSVSRFGGDEFTVLVEELREPVDATRVAERILNRFQSPFTLQNTEVFIGLSIGIVVGSSEYHSAEQVLRDADIAMYRSKAKGGTRFQVFDAGMHLAAQKRLQIENDLRRAIEQHQFEVLLQPIVQIDQGRVDSLEALVRWRHPESGLIAPAEFIHIAEDTGLIVPIGRYVMREACRQLRKLQDSCPDKAPRTVAVNLSAKEFAEPDLIDHINNALRDAGLPGSALRIEITESVAMANVDRVEKTLRQMKQLKVGISIDDFGTGYSSLSYLKRFPVDILKIDRSFISSIDQDKESREIVRTILNLASSLQMKTVAEGTETASQIAVLRSIGCEYAQGYYYSKPVSREVVEAVLQGSSDKAVSEGNSGIGNGREGEAEATAAVTSISA